MQDIILINKPRGISSFDVIRELRRRLGVRKMGHAGTLDPLAEGLLIIGVGQGTKKLTQLVGLPKTYIFEVLFGKKTTTGDLEGETIEDKKVKSMNLGALRKVLTGLKGTNKLPAPLYSAIKIKGKPLYQYARQGITVKTPQRDMKVYSLKLLNLRPYDKYQVAQMEIHCGSGTYIRTIAEEIGRRLNLPATCKSIKRIAIGDYKLEDAENILT